MSKPVTTVVTVVMLVACSPQGEKVSPAKANFDLLCDQFTQFSQGDRYSKLNSEQRAASLDAQLKAQLGGSSHAYIAWDAIQNAPPSQRYKLFTEAADSVGYPDWQCAAMEQHGHEVGSIFER